MKEQNKRAVLDLEMQLQSEKELVRKHEDQYEVLKQDMESLSKEYDELRNTVNQDDTQNEKQTESA